MLPVLYCLPCYGRISDDVAYLWRHVQERIKTLIWGRSRYRANWRSVALSLMPTNVALLDLRKHIESVQALWAAVRIRDEWPMEGDLGAFWAALAQARQDILFSICVQLWMP